VSVPLGTVVDLPTNSTDYTKLTTDYVGNMIYENGVLKRILTPAGYWQNGIYYYFLKDHLGSNRVVITGSGAVLESSSFYPSGMRFGESAINGGSVQPYRHTGLEMQAMHGLNWIDNNARFRTVSDGGGFTGMDPLAEKDYSISPYAYCKGNPVNRIDPTGMTSTEEYMQEHGGTDAYEREYTAAETDPEPATDNTTAIDNTANKVNNKLKPITATDDYSIKQPEKTFFDPNWEGGHLDPANQESASNWTKQEWTITIGIFGTFAGVGVISDLVSASATIGSYILPSLGLANSVDDIGTNKQGESISQQMTNNPETKKNIANVKGVINIVGLTTSIFQPLRSLSVPKAVSTASDFYSTYLFTDHKIRK